MRVCSRVRVGVRVQVGRWGARNAPSAKGESLARLAHDSADHLRDARGVAAMVVGPGIGLGLGE